MAETSMQRWSAAAIGLLAVLAVVCWLASSQAFWIVPTWAAVIALGQFVRVPGHGGGRVYLGIAAAAAAPPMLEESAAVAAVYAGGLVGSWLVLSLRGEEPGAVRSFVLAQTVALAAYATTYAGVVALTDTGSFEADYRTLLGAAAGVLAWMIVGAATSAAVEYEDEGFAFRYLWLRPLADWPALVSVFAAGIMFALAFDSVRWWALPIAALPYAFSHASFMRYEGSRVTYGQTIRALARIPEVAGLAPEGHAVRTASIAVEVAKDLGLAPGDVGDVEYAALMHDIGRITLNEPAIIKAGYTDEDIARWGSQIVAEAPSLSKVADYVLLQHDPYRRPGVETDESVPTASRIIKVASAYDQAVHEAGLPPIEAIETLHRGAAYDFDPAVVSALRRVMGRRGVIPAER